MDHSQPDYKRIYNDLLSKKYPHKKEECRSILMQDHISVLDIMRLDEIIFNRRDKETNIFNQKVRSYDHSAMAEILEFQKKNRLSNSQTANYFKMSRNTITKWKKIAESKKSELD
ncbi:transposase [Chryseobacterium lactis]|uniref:Helix-turn-helix domain-containing protein n=1 Tax=Chryseobacterium lactis TaxID=1241981 RepID=A0A3G6RHM1_CHRLC|nr:transposase [Chryseobacterium lactis]AZA84155.1 helix-turn-helix domain-containing protein [Chryseobacterium lactis]AZB04542.1 helix-turn-helix domain-containing protein [Chryseobacterium lactis]PNW12710.1 transposase [Chryseobacterium lactis]